MSYMSTQINAFDGVEVEYLPAHATAYGSVTPAYVLVKLRQGHATLGLQVEDARTLVEAVTRILMLHDSVEHLAVEMSVDNEVPVAALESVERAVA